MSKILDIIGTSLDSLRIGSRLVSGIKSLIFDNGFTATINANPTANRVINLPDKSGTLAVTSDIPSVDFEVKSSKILRIYAHFVFNNGDYIGFNSGSGSLATAVNSLNIAEYDAQGIGILRTGYTVSGRCRFSATNGNSERSILLGNLSTISESRSRLLVPSNGTNTFFVLDGWMSSSFTATPSNGIFFYYIHNQNSGNWIAVCRAAGVETRVDTDTPPTTDSYQTRTIVTSSTDVKFYIDGILKATITTNTPRLVGQEVVPNLCLLNSVGTGSLRGINVDYMEHIIELA
jgi:hypothetical protein